MDNNNFLFTNKQSFNHFVLPAARHLFQGDDIHHFLDFMGLDFWFHTAGVSCAVIFNELFFMRNRGLRTGLPK